MQNPDPLTTGEKKKLLEQLSVRIEPVRVSSSYRVRLLIVATAMVILPVLYVALVAGAGWLVYMHATQNAWLLDGRRMIVFECAFRFCVYAGPIVVGGIVVLFMVKTLFSRRPKPPKHLHLDRDDERFLFAFVGALCAALGSPSSPCLNRRF